MFVQRRSKEKRIWTESYQSAALPPDGAPNRTRKWHKHLVAEQLTKLALVVYNAEFNLCTFKSIVLMWMYATSGIS